MDRAADSSHGTGNPPHPIGPLSSEVAAERLIGLDLFRALAIAGVFVAHLFAFENVHGRVEMPVTVAFAGLFGVELFFALSGFLIGGLLLDIVARDRSLRAFIRFMARRWMRTLPLYFLWLAVLVVVLPPLIDPRTHLIAYAALMQNWAWKMPADNWFGVSWSLTVEEWFYLLFSAFTLFLAARGRRRAILIGCIIFIVLPLLARAFFVAPDADLDTGMRKVALLRLDAIAFGVLVATAFREWRATLLRWRMPLFALGAGFLWLTISVMHAPVLLPFFRPLIFDFMPLGFALMLPAAVGMRMTFRPLVGAIRWLSWRSYCLYIVHLSLIEMAWRASDRGFLQAWLCTPVVILASTVLAEISYRFFETPILRRRPTQFSVSDRSTAPAPTGRVHTVEAKVAGV